MKSLLIAATLAVAYASLFATNTQNIRASETPVPALNTSLYLYTTEECQSLGYDGVMCMLFPCVSGSTLDFGNGTCNDFSMCPVEPLYPSLFTGNEGPEANSTNCIEAFPTILDVPDMISNACYNYLGNNTFWIATAPDATCVHAVGGVSGDPHVVGFEGSRYNFDGESGKIYGMISDSGIEVNALVERFVVGAVNGTWMTSIGVATESSAIVVDRALRVMVQGSLVTGRVDLVDGFVIVGEKVTINFPTLGYAIVVKGEHANGASYLNIDVTLTSAISTPHGVLGQTAKALIDETYKFAGVEGIDSDYEVFAITAHDFVLSTYALRRSVEEKRSSTFIHNLAQGGVF